MIQVDADESRWGGFLIDKDAESVIPLIGGRRTRHQHDAETVEEAWRGSHTIVTSNGDDFIREIITFQRRENNRDCRDVWGLLIVPNKAFVRERVLPPLMRDGLDTPMGPLLWPAIGLLNFCLTIRSDGSLTRRRFARCSFCERDTPFEYEWYREIPVIGSKVRV
jgi:hypothetical protein